MHIMLNTWGMRVHSNGSHLTLLALAGRAGARSYGLAALGRWHHMDTHYDQADDQQSENVKNYKCRLVWTMLYKTFNAD